MPYSDPIKQREAQRESAARLRLERRTQRVCLDCSMSITDRGSSADRCEMHAKVQKIKRDARYRAARRGPQRVCLDCSATIGHRGSKAVRCEPDALVYMAWYQTHYHLANAERISKDSARRYAANPKKYAEISARYRAANPERVSKNQARRYAANPEKRAGIQARYQAKKAKLRPLRFCLDCPASISHRKGNAKFCEPCAGEHKRMRDARRDAARRGPMRVCLDCSASIEHRGGTAKRCEPCALKYVKVYRVQYRKDNPELVAENEARARKKANPDKRAMRNARRRARERNQLGTVTRSKADILAEQGGICVAPGCGVSINLGSSDLDHHIPLASGGLHDDSNIQVLCKPCNRSKSYKDPHVFARERGFLRWENEPNQPPNTPPH